jgi:uncharacterized protein YheU (UPF0270 family)
LIDAPPGRRAGGQGFGDLAAFSVSVVVHAVVLVILALCVLPIIIESELFTVSSIDSGDTEDLEVLDLSADFEDVIPEDTETAFVDDIVSYVELPEFQIKSLLPDVSPPVASDRNMGSSTVVSSEQSTIEGAVDSVTERIKRQLERGDLLVVWLLDASHSLVDDRKRVAERLGPFFEEIAADRDEKSHVLLNAVVSFGKSIKQQVAPTEFGERIIEAVEKMPVDRTGKENVFTAVARSARSYRSNWANKQMMIVVWTDETGDDTQSLEETIEICRQNQVTVSVVGPSSVLGAETGLHSYTDPTTKEVYQLPVNRGPDAALPERIELGYWFSARPPRGARGTRRGTPSWYGGRHLRGIASGFSPYQLEQSPRWRAWYDLTRGRLLATSVRLEEFRLALDAVVEKGVLRENTNYLVFVPSLQLKSSEEFRARAMEAETLLRRCIKQNPGTPWAYLAEREYVHGLGVSVQQRTLTLVPGAPANSSQPRLPNF